MSSTVILPSGYCPPIHYFTAINSFSKSTIDIYEYFEKQTYRNRCEILSANGLLKLVIPIEERRNKTIVKDIRISYKENWQKKHWRSIESAYNRSPFFEFYKTEFYTFYEGKKYEFLIDFNLQLLEKTTQLLSLKNTISISAEYVSKLSNANDMDLRPNFYRNEKNQSTKKYIQVFSDKFEFISNLSILDLLFNCGPEAKNYL